MLLSSVLRSFFSWPSWMTWTVMLWIPLNTLAFLPLYKEQAIGNTAYAIALGSLAAHPPARGLLDALATANDTRFGLTSGIVTRSLARANHFRRNARTGCVMVNLPTAGTDYHVPFGGRKGSSYGSREQGRYAAEFFTTVKTAYVAP